MLHFDQKVKDVMLEVRPINEIDTFDQVARDLSTLLGLTSNADISIHFPGTVKRYTGELSRVMNNLSDTAEMCHEGEREQFIAFVGGRAVGMSIITNQVEAPLPVHSGWPNLSGFVLNPYRSMGIGKLSMQKRLQVVSERFDNHAWTYVRKGNTPAERLVLGEGFVISSTVVLGQENQYLCIYDPVTQI